MGDFYPSPETGKEASGVVGVLDPCLTEAGWSIPKHMQVGAATFEVRQEQEAMAGVWGSWSHM